MFGLLFWLLLYAGQGEPYGGCDEAYLYPGTEGAIWCSIFMPGESDG